MRETERGRRHLPFRVDVSELSPTEEGQIHHLWLQDRSVAVSVRSRSGPRSVRVGRRKWVCERRQAVMDHEFCARVLQCAVVFDQLNVSKLARMELVCRKMQVSKLPTLGAYPRQQ